ncbi:MAG: hypothetical protein HFJ40_04525 [Clostridia bacterium]|nr:hypothetical protein [Clostridia bacterium]
MKISIKTIFEEMPKDLSDLEKVRYIYLELGQIFSYNRYYLTEDNSRYLRDIYNDFLTIDMIENGDYKNKLEVICKQISEILSQTINSIQRERYDETLKAKVVGYRDDEENHVAVLLTIGQKNYYLDLYRDLYKIQKGMRTTHFTPKQESLENAKLRYHRIKQDLEGIKCEVIDQKELEKIDKKLGYSMNGFYMDDAISMLKEQMEKEENWEKYIEEYNKNKTIEKEDVIARWKIDFIFKYIKNNSLEQNEMGIVELNKFYKRLYEKILCEKEKKDNRLVGIEISLKYDEKHSEKSILYEIRRKHENLYYIYDKNKKGFTHINEKNIRKLEENRKLKYDCEFAKPQFRYDEVR